MAKIMFKHIVFFCFTLISFSLTAQTLAPDEDATPYTTCNEDGANESKTSDDLASPVNVGTIDDRSCYANYKEVTINGTTWGIYNITDGSNNQDAANTLQPRIERSLSRSQTTGIGSYAKLTGTVRILEVGNINGVSNSNDGTYIMQAKGKHTGEGGSADPAICLYLAKPVYDSGGNQVSFDIYREQINYRGGSGADGRTLVYLTNILKNVETSIELEVGFKEDPSDSSKKIHYSDAVIGGTSYDWNIPEPERGIQSGIRYGAYRVKGGRAQIRWANTVYNKVENEAEEPVVESVQSWNFKTDLDAGDWVKGTQTLDAAIVADGLEVTWEASGVAGANPQNKPKIGITSGAAINATTNKIMAVTLINNSSEPIDVQVKFPRNSDGTNKFYSAFGDDIPENATTSTTYYLDLTGDSEWTGTKDWIEMQLRDTGNTGRDNASSAGSIIFQKIEFIDEIPVELVTITSQATGNWNDANTWVGGVVPTSTSEVIIPDNIVVTVSDTQAANTLKVTNAANVVVESGGALSVTGDVYLGRFDFGLEVRSETSSEAMGTLTVGGSVHTVASDDVTTSASDKRLFVRKTLANDKWYLLSSMSSKQPRVNRMTNSDFRTNATPAYAIAVYNKANATNSKYDYFSTTLTNSDEVTLGAGMSVSVNGTGNTNTTGEFGYKAFYTHGSSVDIAISVDGGTSDAFNLVGNPFLSNLYGNTDANATNVLSQNTSVLEEATLWFWNADTSTWVTKNQSSDAFTIPPVTGFFVKSSVAGGNFTFTKSMETHTAQGSVSSKSASKRFEIDLSVANGKANNNTSIKFIDGMTTSFDNGYDSSMFGGYSSDLEVYTGLVGDNSNKKLAIQSLPNSNFEEMIIPVGLTATAGSQVTFAIEVSNIPAGYNVYLEDRLNDTFTKLNEADAEYEATVTENTTEGRFYIHVKSSVLSAGSELLNSVKIFAQNNSTLKIVGLSQGNTQVSLYNILGEQVLRSNFITNGTHEITLPKLAEGVYIFKLDTEEGSINKKIVLE